MTPVRSVNFCIGTSTGFTGSMFLEWLTRPSTISTLGFLGSAIATAVGWFIARRAELVHARLEIEREERQAQRDQRMADVLLELRIRQVQSGSIINAPQGANPPSIGTPDVEAPALRPDATGQGSQTVLQQPDVGPVEADKASTGSTV
jgi:hypothetical protein